MVTSKRESGGVQGKDSAARMKLVIKIVQDWLFAA
jgi:hypothetical protein